MPSIAVARPLVAPTLSTPRLSTFTRTRSLVLAGIAVAALVARLPALDATGLNEDEMDKLAGAQAYRQGDFVADGEHPALMKLAVLASLEASSAWNAVAPSLRLAPVPVETAVRLPNAIAGVALAIVVYLLTAQFFGPLAALFAGWLWAFDVMAVAINRIAKEDTFVLLFLLLGAWLFERGKAIGVSDPRRAQRWFAGAGAMFGLMLASKYVPYLLGIHVLYFRMAQPHPGANRPDKGRYFGALAGTFLLANFPLLAPGNWLTIGHFVSEQAIQHSGYFFQGRIWPNAMSATPGGIPVYFYAAAVATKVPLAVLALAAVGLWLIARGLGGRARGSVFVLTFLLLTFVPYSLVATKFLRYLLPSLAMLDIAAGVGLVWLAGVAARTAAPPLRLATAAAVAIALAMPAVAWTSSHPFGRMYRNPLGEALSPRALWFPPDELYDAGLREAVAEVALRAGEGDRVLSEAPKTAAFYALEHGRPDLVSTRLEDITPNGHDWLIVQDGHLYYENRSAVARARRAAPVFEIDVHGFRAVEVYRAW